VSTPERTTAAEFPRYSNGEVLADSGSLRWPGLFVRRSRFPRAVDRFPVPATPEPLMSCVLAGSADFRESDVGQAGVRRQLKRGDIFVTRSKTPYELDWKSPVGEELDFIIIHLALRISLRIHGRRFGKARIPWRSADREAPESGGLWRSPRRVPLLRAAAQRLRV
jgi:AraC family transcriptional regulator